ncbi:MAG: type IV secretory system conjugative DNA transfer family protein, partial [Chloroflexi bacterium]|nr:type IV secretory system conjugative DNA transfer family protein [Chloroflexota bacterium]
IDAAIQSGDRAILVVDPHADLVRGILGRVPRAHRDRVVYLDLSDESRPVGLNLLDVHTGRSRARIVDNLMTNFSRIWRDYWGPRMADIFRFSLAALLEANGQLADQLSLLDVAGLLTDAKLRNYVLQRVTDAHVLRWWDEQTRIMHDNPRWWGEIIRPVQDKINFFTLYPVTRHIFGQPDTTLDLTALIQAGQVILVNTAAGIVGAESSALVGATLVDVVADFLRSQAGQSAAVERCRVMVVVDEFHTIPADYEGFTAELAKYGGHLVLGTQSLRRLDVMDQALRPVVFSNISNLFVFQTSAADAEELVGELDEAMTETDLVNLADHACYVKTSRRGQRLPVFSMSTLAPAAGDPATAAAIAAASGERYGRPLDEVQRRIQTLMLERYEPWRGRGGSQGERLDEMPATQQDPTGLDVAPTMGN